MVSSVHGMPKRASSFRAAKPTVTYPGPHSPPALALSPTTLPSSLRITVSVYSLFPQTPCLLPHKSLRKRRVSLGTPPTSPCCDGSLPMTVSLHEDLPQLPSRIAMFTYGRCPVSQGAKASWSLLRPLTPMPGIYLSPSHTLTLHYSLSLHPAASRFSHLRTTKQLHQQPKRRRRKLRYFRQDRRRQSRL